MLERNISNVLIIYYNMSNFLLFIMHLQGTGAEAPKISHFASFYLIKYNGSTLQSFVSCHYQNIERKIIQVGGGFQLLANLASLPSFIFNTFPFFNDPTYRYPRVINNLPFEINIYFLNCILILMSTTLSKVLSLNPIEFYIY